MFRTASQAIIRSSLAAGRGSPSNAIIPSIHTFGAIRGGVSAAGGTRRTLFGSAKKGPGPKTSKNAVARWALAIGGTYYYLTSSVFAEETSTFYKPGKSPNVAATAGVDDDEDLTRPRSHRDLDDLRLHSRTTGTISDAKDTKLITAAEGGATKRPGSQEELKTTAAEHAVNVAVGGATTPEELQEEADQQGAFNPVTGEINWDCPCLGGMPHGPCGEEFKIAFTCFVKSTSDPPGMDCIEHFVGMQDCFRKFPDFYQDELHSGGEESEDEIASAVTADDTTPPSTPPSKPGPAVPLTTEQVQEKVKTEVPATLEGESEKSPVKPESSEAADTQKVKEGVKKEVPPTVKKS